MTSIPAPPARSVSENNRSNREVPVCAHTPRAVRSGSDTEPVGAFCSANATWNNGW